MLKVFYILFFVNYFDFILSVSKDYQNCYCGQTGHFVKIIGGDEAKPHAYPWQVALVGYPKKNGFFCGASIISSRFIVTAGHCFRTNEENYNEKKIKLKIGAHDINNGEFLLIKPKKIKIYEKYTEDNDISSPMFDIALIELEEDLPVNFKIKPICIHSKYFNYYINDLKEKINYLGIDLSYKIDENDLSKNKKVNVSSNLLKKNRKVSRSIQEKDVRPDLFKNLTPIRSDSETPTDQTEIFFDHPNKELKKLVDETVEEYLKSVAENPDRVYDFSQEFTLSKLIVAGWGTLDPYEFKMPDKLMVTEVDQRKSEVCENTYGDDVYFRSKSICANRIGKDACTGDSGGPLVNIQFGRANLYGIVSFGRSCGAYSAPGVYTRISPFLKWILINTIDSEFCAN